AHLQDVAAAPSLRVVGMARDEGGGPLLDHCHHLRAAVAVHVETAMNTTLVIGAGKSGVAAANFLAGRGDRVSISDSNPSPDLPYKLDDRVVRFFGNQDNAVLNGVTEIVISPGVPLDITLLQRAAAMAIPVIGEIELAWRHLRGTVIAVTGSNGKSTTTALIGEILKVAGRQPIVAGNIGSPLISAIDFEKPRTYVLELSSF